MSGRYESALRGSGPYVQIEAAEWLPEATNQDTPEYLLDAMREAQAKRARDALHTYLELIPAREALAIMLSEGLFGHAPHLQTQVASYIGANSQQAVSYAVRRAKARIRYLLTRPKLDERALSKVLSEHQLGIVREMFAVASFTEVARHRWPYPEGRDPQRRHAWHRSRAAKIKKEFFRAVAKVERAGLEDQAHALRHLVENMRVLSYHGGKGRRG